MAIVGSPRLKGNSSCLVDAALAEAGRLGAETEKVVISRHEVNPCLGHHSCASFAACRQKDDAVWILERFYTADGVILASPVYYYNVTAQMKAFIDRSYFYYKRGLRSRARCVGLIVVAENEGIQDTLYTMNQFVDWACDVGPERRPVVSGYVKGPPGAVRHDPSLMEGARELGRRIVSALSD